MKMFRGLAKGEKKGMDEEEGEAGSSSSRRTSLTTPPTPSSSFWNFSTSIRSLLSFRPSAPVNPVPAPEIIVTTCSSETIVSGTSGGGGPGIPPDPPNPPFSLAKSTSSSSVEDLLERDVSKKGEHSTGEDLLHLHQSSGDGTGANKSSQQSDQQEGDQQDGANSPLLNVPSSSEDSSSVSTLSRSQDITVMEATPRRSNQQRRQSEPSTAPRKQSTGTRPSSPSAGAVLMNPLLLLQSKTVGNTLRLPKTFRKRSSSYSDLSSRKTMDPSESPGGSSNLLPELSATELRLILIRNLKKTEHERGSKKHRKSKEEIEEDKGKYISQLNEILRLPDHCDHHHHSHHHHHHHHHHSRHHYRRNSKGRKKSVSNSEEIMDCCSSGHLVTPSKQRGSNASSCGAAVAAAGLGLLPAATSVASLLDNRMIGMNNLQLPDESGSTKETQGGHGIINSHATLFDNPMSSLPRVMRGRPRLLSHPEFMLPESIQSAPAVASAKRFFIPPYFRRPSQLSTVSRHNKWTKYESR